MMRFLASILFGGQPARAPIAPPTSDPANALTIAGVTLTLGGDTLTLGV